MVVVHSTTKAIYDMTLALPTRDLDYDPVARY
jgi:hypothetical protein